MNFPFIIKTHLSYIEVGTPTFRHGNGMNNFINRENPLGWEFGSDSQELKLGLDVINKKKYIFNLTFGNRLIGQESIIYRP